MTSLCDKCFAPGACCKRLSLSYLGEDEEYHQITFWDDEGEEAIRKYMKKKNYSFVINEKVGTWVDEESGRTYSAYNYNCTALLPNGRCGRYKTRPKLCRAYEAASDGLCVHFGGAETGEQI